MSGVNTLYLSSFESVAGQSFDYIVVGAGAYGTSFCHRVLEQQPAARILVLDKGGYLIPDHIQNLPPSFIKLNTTVGTRPWTYSGSDGLDFMPQIPYLGGRALFWNAWTPQPDEAEMPDWPREAIDRLRAEWYRAGEFLGRRYSLRTAGNANAPLQGFMGERLFARLGEIRGAIPQGSPAELDSAMATGQGVEPEQWAKFAPIPVLIGDTQTYAALKVVGNAEVLRLNAADGRVTELVTACGSLQVGAARVILACNTLEAGFILRRSFPQDPLPGNNLCGHIRSWLAARVPAASVPALTGQLQAAAYYLPGRDRQSGRMMHTHISVVHNPQPAQSQRLLYSILPDASTPQAVAAYQDPGYVVFMLHSMGEFLGERSADSWNRAGCGADDQAEVKVNLRPQDLDFWKAMDQTTFDVMRSLVGDAPVEYQYTDAQGVCSWDPALPDNIRNRGLVHEAGTLWMGSDPANSVTDVHGRLHCYPNVYGLGSMLFPRPGSFNPTLTGVAQAFALARELAGAGPAEGA